VITAVVAGVVGFVAGAAAMAMGRRGAAIVPKALPVKENDVLRASLEDVRAGGLLHVRNMGDTFEDVDLEVERFDRYAAGRDEWHLLEGTYKNRPVALEWQKTRGALRAWEHKRLRALTPDQVGLGGPALEALAVGATHAHEGASYQVEVAGKALRHDGGTGFGKEHLAWRLVTADGKKVLHVERWGDKPPVAWAGEAIDPGMVEIYKVRA
jgi:hypothetical protein